MESVTTRNSVSYSTVRSRKMTSSCRAAPPPRGAERASPADVVERPRVVGQAALEHLEPENVAGAGEDEALEPWNVGSTVLSSAVRVACPMSRSLSNNQTSTVSFSAPLESVASSRAPRALMAAESVVDQPLTGYADVVSLAKTIRRNLRRLREAKGILQQDLARRAGVTPEHLCRVEMGSKEPSLELLDALARGMGVDGVDFLRPRR